jgi:hypothetical protein
MRKPIFCLGFSLLPSLFVALAVACGGGGPEGAGAKNASSSGSPEDTASRGSGEAQPSSGASGSTPAGSSGGGAAGSSGTTTTTQLGDGGDLQGAKLGGKVHTENETKGESGPKGTHNQSAQEPGRSPKDIQAIVASHRDEARACYDKALATHPGLDGDLDIKWVIDPTGTVTDASVDTARSQILEPSVGNCIIEVIKRLKFAASGKGYESRAHYPFNFHSKTFTPKDAGK